ncbi:hypothetical protein P691DRAFT_763345 [Macrolepiota fuliginosa MF-IS2]|uniref:Uncharacterized protein n=1 Tax=Macrolepiota fuliginosa MF-IS2 TaxID=1400762 RepID=A0A9P5X7C3_9AGAR|nr:hypothetical protein P691DRAFT_763345 [Macrolepiota fuliginosa MF-IS2]
MPDDADWNQSYILGCGQRKCFLWSHPSGDFHIQPYIEPSIVEPPAANFPTTERHTVERPTDEQPLAVERPASAQAAIERPAFEQLITEYPTTEYPSAKTTNRTFMQRIKFWRTPTSRRLVRHIRSLVRVRYT